jgi:ABC-type branched-subunit amino acid transport system ATPase component
MTALLNVQGLRHQFAGAMALDGVDLLVEDGRIIGLIKKALGRSGMA